MKCHYCNNKERTIRVWPWHCSCGATYQSEDDPGTKIEPRLPRRFDNCTHRGPEVRKEKCPTCKGHVMVKVFQCSVHGECSLAQSSVKCCAGCGEYASPASDPQAPSVS